MADSLYANTSYSGGLASSYVPQNSYATKRRSMLDDYLSRPVEDITPETTVVTTPNAVGGTDTATKIDKPEATGMSRNMANGLAGAQIGLGLLGFLENRKTGKLQREALRHDIDTAKEHRANRAALGASWSKAWSGNGG